MLVLDEPTLGLDVLYRKQFYDSLLNDYFDRSRSIVVTTHQFMPWAQNRRPRVRTAR